MIIHTTTPAKETNNSPTKIKTNLIIELEYAEEVAFLSAFLGASTAPQDTRIVKEFPTKLVDKELQTLLVNLVGNCLLR